MIRAGRNSGPEILDAAYGSCTIGDTALYELIVEAWTAADWPESHLGRARWVELFRRARVAPTAPPCLSR
jgi:hypothetical protein